MAVVQCNNDLPRGRKECVKSSPSLKEKVLYKTSPGQRQTDRLHISIIIKLVFHLRVTITIKGETQMGSVSNKDSIGY